MPAPGQVLCTRARIDLSCLDGATISGMATMLPSRPFEKCPQCDRTRSRVVSCTYAGDFSREFSCGSIGKISLGVKKFGRWLRPEPTLLWPSGGPHNARPYARSGDLAHGSAWGVKSTRADAAALPVLIEDESGAGNDQ
jgi:hypothetical protein